MNCFCGQSVSYHQCCQPLHAGQRAAQTAEQLMRSRFSAYVLQLVGYIANTYFPQQQSAQALAEIREFAESARFISLQVMSCGDRPAVSAAQFPPLPKNSTTTSAECSYVHFKVQFFIADKLHLLEEHSRFLRIDGLWFYIDGVLIPHPVVKTSRNEPCPCGSGKKFKVCKPHWLNFQPSSHCS